MNLVEEAQEFVRDHPDLCREIVRLWTTKRVYGLTRRQKDLLDFLRAYKSERAIPPSYDEMMVGIGLASKSNVHRLIMALEKRGLVQRIPGHARSAIPADDAFLADLAFEGREAA